MNAASLRKGWCPGALRPMRTGDGWLVRVRAAGGRLDFDSAEAIADCAMHFGNGALEISSRANLQLRGIGDDDLPRLQQRLAKAGLLDDDADSESVRNIVASPLADVDPAAVLDTAPVVAALEARLARDAALHPLPAKFCFVVDAGGALPLGDVEADIRLEALAQGGERKFAVSLGGDAEATTFCTPAEAADAAVALARAFLDKSGDGDDAPRRMRELVARRGAASMFRAAGLDLAPAPRPAGRCAAPRDYLGIHKFGETYCVGAAPALGRMTGEDLAFVAREALRLSGAGLRLAPWRALLIPGLHAAGAQAMSAALARRDFLLDPADPRLSVVACSGAPKCANAARAVQIEALQLAPLLPGGGIVLHVSGCEKGCAHGRAAPLTLVARPGGYDLVVDGKASDRPVRQGLTIEAAASLLAQTYGGAG
jgi:precorrin-3B synthase